MTCIIPLLEAKIQIKQYVFISFSLRLPYTINTPPKFDFRCNLLIVLCFYVSKI